MINKKEHMHRLFDYYKELLTDRQKNIYEAVAFDDLSLAEASEQFEVSRNAIHDTIKKVENILEDFEAKLELVKKASARQKLYEQIDDIELKDELEALEID